MGGRFYADPKSGVETRPTPERGFTLGEYRVGITFNPTKYTLVDRIKRRAAELIDYIQIEIDVKYDGNVPDEVARLRALALTEIESAAMWAVKAATKPAPR